MYNPNVTEIVINVNHTRFAAAEIALIQSCKQLTNMLCNIFVIFYVASRGRARSVQQLLA
jgi:hypothetical protein